MSGQGHNSDVETLPMAYRQIQTNVATSSDVKCAHSHPPPLSSWEARVLKTDDNTIVSCGGLSEECHQYRIGSASWTYLASMAHPLDHKGAMIKLNGNEFLIASKKQWKLSISLNHAELTVG